MKIDCFKNKLLKSVLITEKIVAKNLSLPILKNILLQTEKNYLKITATNLEVGVEIKIPAKIYTEGQITVNPYTFGAFLNNLNTEDKITLISENGNLKVETNNNKTLIKGDETEDFPLLPKVVTGKEIKIKASDFISGLKSVVFSASVSDIKPEISGVYIYLNNQNLIFVATDSFRLAEKSINLSQNYNFDSLIIPLKNSLEIIRLFDDFEGELKINSDGNQLSIFADNIHFTSRIIDGVYPDYKQIMPKDFNLNLTVDKNQITQALKLNTIFVNKFNQINLLINIKNQEIILNTANQETGENTTIINNLKDINLKNEDLLDFNANYNIRYIVDGLNILKQDEVFIGCNEENKPLLIKNPNDKSFNYIIMPVSR